MGLQHSFKRRKLNSQNRSIQQNGEFEYREGWGGRDWIVNEYKCDQCHKSFKVEKSLKIHVRSVHDGILFQCDQCPSKYPRKTELKVHIKQEHEGLTFLCNLCGKSLANSKSLRVHMQVHEDEKVTYKCEQCNKILRSKRSLERHTKCAHEGIHYKDLIKNAQPHRNHRPKKKVKIEPEAPNNYTK